METIKFNDYEIDIFGDATYTLNSTDNVNKYEYEYLDYELRPENYSGPRYGIVVRDGEEIVHSAVIISGTTGANSPDGNSLVDGNHLVIIIGDSTFCLLLPELNLKWKTICGSCGFCIDLHLINDGYIVHGECSILKINREGQIQWEFSGRDIFVNADGKDVFEINEEFITVNDWDNYIYKIRLVDGKAI